MNGSVGDGLNAQGTKWHRRLRHQSWSCERGRQLPQSHPVIAKRGALTLSHAASDLICRTKRRADDQNFFGGRMSFEPVSGRTRSGDDLRLMRQW